MFLYNNLFEYINENNPEKDIILYEYGNACEFLIHRETKGVYKTQKTTGEKITSIKLFEIIWTKTPILAEYLDSNCIFLQVDYKNQIKASNYQERKEQARAKAQAIQQDQTPKSWGELAEQGEHLQKLAKRYGLIKEFHNEGII